MKFAAALFLISRLIHPISAILSIGSLLGNYNSYTLSIIITVFIIAGFNLQGRNMMKYIDVAHWKEYSSIYASLVLLVLVESSLIKYLPWSSSSFCKASGYTIIISRPTSLPLFIGGYPDLYSFRGCSYGISANITIIIIINYHYQASLCSH